MGLTEHPTVSPVRSPLCLDTDTESSGRWGCNTSHLSENFKFRLMFCYSFLSFTSKLVISSNERRVSDAFNQIAQYRVTPITLGVGVWLLTLQITRILGGKWGISLNLYVDPFTSDLSNPSSTRLRVIRPRRILARANIDQIFRKSRMAQVQFV